MYDAQEKARRDYQWAMQSSRHEGQIEGEIKGEVKGRITGEIRLIHALQLILFIPKTSQEELSQLTLEQLQQLTAELQEKAHKR